MRKTKLQQLRMSKRENKMFACKVEELADKVGALNELFADGWMTEETMVSEGTYVVLLKKEHEGRKVFYVDVGGMTEEEIGPYMERVKELVSNPKEAEDFFIPSR